MVLARLVCNTLFYDKLVSPIELLKLSQAFIFDKSVACWRGVSFTMMNEIYCKQISNF